LNHPPPTVVCPAGDVGGACHDVTVTAASASSGPRTEADRCPGLLRPHLAADGALIRLRLPGGIISASALAALSAVADEFGDGQVQLTSRGNVQLRGVPVGADGEVPAELIEQVVAAGLIPSARHELTRNITCSPMTGRVGGLADLRPVVAELDELLCGTASLAKLPGRFLFGLDDGGDIPLSTSDLGVQAVSADQVVVCAGGLAGPVIPISRAAATLVAMAESFLARRGTGGAAAWHVRELSGGGRSLLGELAPSDLSAGTARSFGWAAPARYGVLRQHDGRTLYSLIVPLGSLNVRQVGALVAVAGTASGQLIATPWRGIVVPDLVDGSAARAALSRVGLFLEGSSGWRAMSACTGAPGCRRAGAPTRPVAAVLATEESAETNLPVHVVACERRCGSPAGDHVEVLVSSGSKGQQFTVTRRSTALPADVRPARIAVGLPALARVVGRAGATS